ncbi:MAG: YkgJ family cysteine cluster protein [Candidatus Woesearchaeota archaeon]
MSKIHKYSFLKCLNCMFETKCCKIEPPFIFEFEKPKFKDFLLFKNYKKNKIALIKKQGRTCVFLKNNRCKIYSNRPFNCRIFPFDIKKINGKFFWILWDFCYGPKNFDSKEINKLLLNFDKYLYKIDEKELELYSDYTNESKFFKNLKFKIIRELNLKPNIKIIKYKNNKFLFINDYLWMWDTPQEREIQKFLADKAFGDVLVVGYGFGILTKFVSLNPRVKSVTTVEKFKEIIEKIKSFDKIYGNIIISDFYDLPENKKYDCVIGDIWPDIDAKFLEDYVKFKKKAKKILKKKGRILAWGKDYFEYLLNKKGR